MGVLSPPSCSERVSSVTSFLTSCEEKSDEKCEEKCEREVCTEGV
jgi:hypothetical protein